MSDFTEFIRVSSVFHPWLTCSIPYFKLTWPRQKSLPMNLTEYLFHRLRELGVGHTFGIPGDFVLPVYAVQESLGFPTVVCCHEPGVGFAADAYARLKGLGVALATYGPGR